MAVSRLLNGPRSTPVTTTMSNSGVFRVFVVAVVVLTSVGLSDSASVPISSSPAANPITTTTKDDADLELLASSKILMDHTSSTFPTSTSKEAFKITGSLRNSAERDDEDGKLEKNLVVGMEERKKDGDSSSSSGTVSTLSLQESKKFSRTSQPEQSVYSSSSSTSGIGGGGGKRNERNSYEMSSPLHVARCRATCLEKLQPKEKSGPVKTTSDSSENVNTSPDEMHLLPLLRLRKRRAATSTSPSASKPSWSCQNSSDCLTCWKSCELFELKDNKNSGEDGSSSYLSSDGGYPQGEINEASREIAPVESRNDDGKDKQSDHGCATLDAQQCLAGCKVACSFYETFSSRNGASVGSKEEGEQEPRAFKGDPVVATKHETVVKIVPGKITWPPSSSSAEEEVVYVVIQEYPDRKWRQIAQTTETSIDIPMELTSAMSTKLRSVRVLVVGPEGLQSVYSPEKVRTPLEPETTSDKSTHFGKESGTVPATTAQTKSKGGEVTASESDDSSSPLNTNDHSETDPVDPSITSSTPTETITSHSRGAASLTPSIDNGLHVEGPFSFELRVVSLIHQKSLVIAELKWDEIGSNPSQEYLITWELTGGGLKGHLVTDSTSVTLSLWPDTTYQIQVSQFLLNLDADGEQPESSTSSTSIKSLPLIVDTSEASYPMEKPSALLSGSIEEREEDEDDYEDEDVSFREGNETGGEEENHKSFTGGFLNMTLLLAIAISALIFVLVILTVAAFTWTKMRKVSAENGFSDSCTSPMITPTKNCERKEGYSFATEPEPLLSQEDCFWEEYCHVPSPVYYTTTIPSHHSHSYYSPYEKRGSPPTTVSVISTSTRSPPSSRVAPCSSYLNYYRGTDEGGCLSSNMAYSLLNESTATASGELGCPSRSSGGLH